MAHIIGPEVTGKLDDRDTADPGTLTNEIKTDYLLFLGMANIKIPVSETVVSKLGLGAGIVYAKLKHKQRGTGFYSTENFSRSASKTGLCFEISPSFLFNLSNVSLEAGARFTMLPEIKRTDQHFGSDWDPFSLFVGLHF